MPTEAFTLFVPTNTAFAGPHLDRMKTESWMASESRELLDNHLIDTPVSFDQLVGDSQGVLVTRSGISLRVLISSTDGATYLILPNGGRAKIQSVDIESGGGIVHVIDRVIQLPKSD